MVYTSKKKSLFIFHQECNSHGKRGVRIRESSLRHITYREDFLTIDQADHQTNQQHKKIVSPKANTNHKCNSWGLTSAPMQKVEEHTMMDPRIEIEATDKYWWYKTVLLFDQGTRQKERYQHFNGKTLKMKNGKIADQRADDLILNPYKWNQSSRVGSGRPQLDGTDESITALHLANSLV